MLTTTPLLDQALEFRRDASQRVPGRLAEIIDGRLGEGSVPDDLDEAERVVLDLAEQFVLDAHAITDARFARLSEFYTPADQVAILFHLALADGFTKLARVQPETADLLGGGR